MDLSIHHVLHGAQIQFRRADFGLKNIEKRPSAPTIYLSRALKFRRQSRLLRERTMATTGAATAAETSSASNYGQ